MYKVLGEVRTEPLDHTFCPPAQEVVEWIEQKLNFRPDPVQCRVLRAATERSVILNCTRQWGKTTVAAAMAAYEAVNFPDRMIVVISPGERQSARLVRKVTRMVEPLGLRLGKYPKEPISAVFPNGSSIIGLPSNEDTIRGYSADLLLVDEAARVEEDVYLAVRPMLAATNGRIWMMSTPDGQKGFFWKAWEKNKKRFEKISVTAEDCPRISKEFLEEEREEMTESKFRQEYFCEFQEVEGGAFKRKMIDGAVSWEFEPLRLT